MHNKLQVSISTHSPNDNLDALAGRVGTTVQELERKATMPNLINVLSLIFFGIALLMAMTAIMKF
ncbi:hypothetical protein RHGRI_030995 [Rhododendron griersonianum]|uniref:Uncharacterized protein n=1 Tax=Rhododendron griersonianum TaxID=479676 RepID=A0AAV6I6Q1_9ERIC|nr:hypothetical protein RHGRI_030995 [Rhododendron griersonianum]